MPASTTTYSIIIEPLSPFRFPLFVLFFIRQYISRFRANRLLRCFHVPSRIHLSAFRTQLYSHRTFSLLDLPPALADNVHARNAAGKYGVPDLDYLFRIGLAVEFLRHFVHRLDKALERHLHAAKRGV